jgi:hypothetical protein
LGRAGFTATGPKSKKFLRRFFQKVASFFFQSKKKAAHEAPPSLGRKRPRKTGEKTHPVEGLYRRPHGPIANELCAAQSY